MALQISTYVDPGVYIGEVVVPGAINIATTPTTLGVIGIGDRTKQVTNEAVQRGLVEQEALTLINQTGAITSISAPVLGIQTLTAGAAAFPLSIIGKTVAVGGATSGANNGTFIILDRPSATTITYLNALGVVQAGAAGTFSVTPYVQLAFRANRALQNTTAFRNGTILSDSFIGFPAAAVQGDVTAVRTFVPGTNDAMVLTLDGIIPITLRWLNGSLTLNDVVTVVQVGGTEFTISYATPVATTTMANVANAINAVLISAGAAALGYGAAYAGAARSLTSGIRIVSPITTPSSNVEVRAPIAQDLNNVVGSQLFTTYAPATGIKAASFFNVSRLVYSATAVYTVDYINIDSNADTLNSTPVQEIIGIGSAAGIANYSSGIDYVQTGDTVDWGGTGVAPDTAPAFRGSNPSPYAVVSATSDTLRLSFDGRAAVDVDLIQAAGSVLGFTYALISPLTAAQVAGNINATIANSSVYGPEYKNVAAAVVDGANTYVQLTSPTEGTIGSVTLSAATLDATTIIFGLQSTQLPYSVTGAGKRPVLAAVYFTTYTITRATADYAAQQRFFSLDQARASLGNTTENNPLMIAMELAFANNAPQVVAVQVNDASSPGTPTRNEFLASLNSTLKTDIITDLVLLSTDLAIQTDLKDHVEFASGPTEKRYRRGWFGMARSTPIGDKDTPNSYVYLARRTLQYAPDSPGRGRLILVAPPQLTGVSRDIQLPDTSTVRVDLDSTFLAVAIAAKKSSFTSPAASMARKSVTGFNVDDVTEVDIWTKTERGLLAGQGCMVVTFDAGVFKILDPVTTEVGGGGLAAFAYESTTSQKDNVSRKMEQALDANIIGVVPTDLADFMIDIKLIIRNVLAGEITAGAIAPFKNADGSARGIDLTKDIEVEQDPNNPTKFFFRYFFNLRYPALRLFGEFSVDRAFFSTAA